MNFNPTFFHLVKSPYWWQLYFFWVTMALLSIFFSQEAIGSAFAFFGMSSYSLFCFGILYIKRFRNKFVRDSAYWGKYHTFILNFYAFILGIGSLGFLNDLLVTSTAYG